MLTSPLLLILLLIAPHSPQASSPKEALDDLLAADRAFSAAAAKTDLVSGLMQIFADDVTIPIPGGRFVNGKAAFRTFLEADSLNSRSRLTWSPINGGISADGLHGFTLGYAELTRPGGAVQGQKYLAYWIKTASGWRVAVYKRINRSVGPVSLEMRSPLLPARSAGPDTATTLLERYRQSLAATEQSFSDAAQKIGLQAAFIRFGNRAAANIGGGGTPGFTFGAEAIGHLVGADEPPGPARVVWSADRVLVASSGDLGVTIGLIRQAAAGTAGATPQVFAFFTIWSRTSPAANWLYVAE